MQEHQQFFESFLGKPADSFEALPQSGSSRINYIGKSKNQTYVITYNENIRENKAFFYFSNVFSDLGLNTPKILEINSDEKIYVQEFLGEQTLSEIIAEEALSDRVKILVKKSLENLFQLQQKTLENIDYSKSFEYECYDDLPITHDLYYFKNFLVDILEIEYHKSTLLKEFKVISEKVQALMPQSLMIRDFQSRNILVDSEDNIYFIDYQSAMQGPAAYDVISFLYQAKANFPEAFKEEMLDYYTAFWDVQQQPFLREAFQWMKLMRFLQVLGAYGLRGLIQRKQHFLDSLQLGINNLSLLAESWETVSKDFPELSLIIKKLKSHSIEEKIKNLIIHK